MECSKKSLINGYNDHDNDPQSVTWLMGKFTKEPKLFKDSQTRTLPNCGKAPKAVLESWSSDYPIFLFCLG